MKSYIIHILELPRYPHASTVGHWERPSMSLVFYCSMVSHWKTASTTTVIFYRCLVAKNCDQSLTSSTAGHCPVNELCCQMNTVSGLFLQLHNFTSSCSAACLQQVNQFHPFSSSSCIVFFCLTMLPSMYLLTSY